LTPAVPSVPRPPMTFSSDRISDVVGLNFIQLLAF
jgi:hypothetical protein